VAERKPFLLRVDPALLEALQRWANDDLRSLNGQIEFVLRRAVQQAGRAKADQPDQPNSPDQPNPPNPPKA
jgi:hypothetical protein